jgi:predicted nucleic acid-binding protein
VDRARVVLDTDVASLIIKKRLPASLAAKLAGGRSVITFVTLGELTKWAVMRNWGAPRRAALERWVAGRGPIRATEDVARKWGEISGYAERRGRPRPINDTWIAACCLTFTLPLATLNVSDFGDFVDHEGLELITA